jgi:hypothetical protein
MCVTTAAGKCLPNCFVSTEVSSGFAIPAFSRHVTVLSAVYNCCWSSPAKSFLETSPPGGPGICIYIPQEQGGPVITPRYWIPLSSPPTTRRATVEVFEPASTRGSLTILSLSYVTTDSQSASLSWNKAPIWGL